MRVGSLRKPISIPGTSGLIPAAEVKLLNEWGEKLQKTFRMIKEGAECRLPHYFIGYSIFNTALFGMKRLPFKQMLSSVTAQIVVSTWNGSK